MVSARISGVIQPLQEIKFVYSEKATKFCEISTLLLSTVHSGKNNGESQCFVKINQILMVR